MWIISRNVFANWNFSKYYVKLQAYNHPHGTINSTVGKVLVRCSILLSISQYVTKLPCRNNCLYPNNNNISYQIFCVIVPFTLKKVCLIKVNATICGGIYKIEGKKTKLLIHNHFSVQFTPDIFIHGYVCTQANAPSNQGLLSA